MMRHETGPCMRSYSFNHRVGVPIQAEAKNLKPITSSQTGSFPVKVILLVTVCLKSDRLQESR